MRMAHDIQAAVSRVSRVSEPLPGSFSSHGPWLPWLQLGRDSEPPLGFLESEEAELRSGGRLCTLRHLCQVLRLPSGCQAHSCHTVATLLDWHAARAARFKWEAELVLSSDLRSGPRLSHIRIR